MRPNAKTTFAVLALLFSGNTPWACESRGIVDDNPSSTIRQVSQPLTPRNNDAAVLFEPWYETCGDLGEASREKAEVDSDARGDSGVHQHASKSEGAAGTFAIPSTAAYGWVAIHYTRGQSCGSAKVYLDGRFVESLELRSANAAQRCERVYYLEDHSASAHRIEVLIDGSSGIGSDGYACLDSVVAGW